MLKVYRCLILSVLCAIFCTNAAAQNCGGITISADVTKGCPPLLVKFTAKGAPAGSTYNWNFGNGFVTANDTTFRIFTISGKHAVQLRINLPNNGGTCNLQLKDSIEILPALVPQIKVTPGRIICNGQKRVTFKDNTPGVVSREWIIDGVNYKNAKDSIVHNFSTVGAKHVSLRITNSFGCTTIMSDNKYVYIVDSTDLDFCGDFVMKRTETKVKFTPAYNPPGRTVTSYTWSFPGGSPSSYSGKTPPEVTYSRADTAYPVTLKVTTSDGCSYTRFRNDFVRPFIDWPNPTACINEVIYLKAYIGIKLPSGNIQASYPVIDIPHSIPVDPKNPFVYYYQRPGKHKMNFSFKASANSACTNTISYPDYLEVLGPAAGFYSSNRITCSAKDTIHFINTTNSLGAPNVKYEWRIYDKDTVLLPNMPIDHGLVKKNLSYMFPKPGIYTVSLTTKSSNGCVDSFIAYNYVSIRHPKPDFGFDTTRICLGTPVPFQNLTYPPEDEFNPYSYMWIVQHADSVHVLAISTDKVPGKFIPNVPGKYNVTLVIRTNAKCTDSIKKSRVFEVVGMQGSIRLNKEVSCTPATIRASVNLGSFKTFPPSNVSKLKFQWMVREEGATILNPNDSVTDIIFKDPKCYNVFLYVFDAFGCTATILTKNPSLCVGQEAKFTADSNYCPGRPVQLYNSSELSPDAYKWLVEPSQYAYFTPSDSDRSPSIVYNRDTCYTLKLVSIKNYPDGICMDTITKNICVKMPMAEFSSSSLQNQCAPVIFSFTNKSRNAHDYIWDFGDGNKIRSTNKEVYHVYNHNNPSGYEVKLIAIDLINGCADTIVKSDFIKIIGPAPKFTVSQRSACDSAVFNFTNISQDVNKFLFDYGDGSPFDSLSIKPHFYKLEQDSADSIVFYPLMIAMDTSICKQPPFWRDTIVIYRSAIAGFSSDVTSGCPPLAVQFKDTSRYSPKRYWDFDGDGIIDDTARNPVFVYNKEGSYDVTQIVINGNGCADTLHISSYINVLPIPQAAVMLRSKVVCGSAKITFTDSSNDHLYSIMDYGDGSPRDSAVFQPHTYNTDSFTGQDSIIFYPVLRAYNISGCYDSVIERIVVHRLSSPGFSSDVVAGCTPLQVAFSDTSKFSVLREWDFNNDGITDDTSRNPVYTFTTGIHPVKLKLTSRNGCKDSVFRENYIQVNSIPVADFSASDTLICVNTEVTFTDKSTVSDSIVRWLWKFDEPAAETDTSSDQNPVFTFLTAGYRNISLTVWDKLGCSDTKTFPAVFVEDSLPPVNTSIRYVTVVDDNTVKISWEESAIHDFAEYVVRRGANPDTVVFSALNVNDTTFTESNPAINTSSQPYCYDLQTNDLCGNASERSISHCTIHLTAAPYAIAANKLDWTAYIGWGAVKNYTIYRSEPSKNPTVLAVVNENTLSYIDTNICDRNYCYYIVAEHPVAGDIVSKSNTACSTPEYISQSSPIRLVRATVKDDVSVKINWETGIQPNIKHYIIDRFDAQEGELLKYAITTQTEFTDQNVDVQKHSYTYNIRVEDLCGNISPQSNKGKSILLQNQVKEDKIYLSWTSYKQWAEGVEYYILQVQKRDKSFATLHYAYPNDTFFVLDTAFTDIDTSYCFKVTAVSNALIADTSTSNLSCAVLPSRVYVPNAFSPNDDDLNDTWKPNAISLYNHVGTQDLNYNLKIYDRWGSLVFETTDLFHGWDGRKNGKKLPEGVYFYIIKASGIDKGRFILKGNITLLNPRN